MTDLFTPGRTQQRQASTRLAPAAPPALTREQVVGHILTINQSATAEYLAQFAESELSKYLDHLLNAQEPRGRYARWDRPGDAPAIMTRRRAS